VEDFDIRVILYLRRVDLFAESMFKELLFRKDYRGRYPFARFLEEQDALFRYDARIREFEDCLGPVSVHAYDALKGTGVVPHFFSLIGATPPGTAASDARVRRSASNAGAWFLLQLAQQRDLSPSDRRRVLEFCLSDAWPEPPDAPRSLWPSATEHSAFLDTYRSATLEPLLTAVDAGPLEYGPLPAAQFARCSKPGGLEPLGRMSRGASVRRPLHAACLLDCRSVPTRWSPPVSLFTEACKYIPAGSIRRCAPFAGSAANRSFSRARRARGCGRRTVASS